MSNKFISVIFLVNLSDKLILSRSTISPSEAAAEYHRRIKLIEAGHNISDSLPDVPVDSVSTLDENILGRDDKIVPDELYTTTLDPDFVKKVKRPLGYHKQLLLNKTNLQVSKIQVGLTDETSTKHVKSTTPRWTPYPDYDSSEERALQRKCPERIHHIIRLRQYHEMKNKPLSYSSESVPSSCECHAGNWSQSYDEWEKWKQKQCKPGFLNLEYGLNQEGTRFRKGHEPQWYKDEQANNAQSMEDEDVSSQENRMKSPSRRKYKKNHSERQVKGQQPRSYPHQKMVYNPQPNMGYPPPEMVQPPQAMGYPPQHIGYPQQAMGYPQQAMGYPQQAMGYPQPAIGYPPQHMGYPPQHMGYPPPHMGYPPLYYPQSMKYNPPNQPAGVDPLAYEKLEELHKDIKELKERKTVSLWEQYLQLKEKFEPLQKTSSTISAKEKFNSYRKVERREPYFSKIQSNVHQIRPNNQSQYLNNRARIQFNEQYQRTLQNQDVYRQNHFLQEDHTANERETVANHFQRITRDHIYKNEPFNRFKTGPGSYTLRQYYRVNDSAFNERRVYVSRGTLFPTRGVYQKEWQTNSWSYRPREGYSHRPKPRVSEHFIQDVKWRAHDTTRPQITTLPPPTPLGTISNMDGEKTTENPYKMYQRYKAQYEFPDYVGEKRRLLRAKEKEAKRLLYKARGLEYDEGPPRTTTRPSTTTYSKWTFENRMEYFKWMFGDESLPIETPTRTPFNNAPTFDMAHEEGQKAYLKWLLDDKTLEIDPLSD